jgi:hypothetical protein
MDYRAAADNQDDKDGTATSFMPDLSPTTNFEESMAGGRTRVQNMAGAPGDAKPEGYFGLTESGAARDGEVTEAAGGLKVKRVP